MSRWTHNLCAECYAAEEPGREPHQLRDADEETCCRCGALNRDGIFYRAKPGAFRCCRHGDDDD